MKIKKRVYLLVMVLLASLIPVMVAAEIVFRNGLTGAPIDFSFGKKGEETEAVTHFMATGENIYNQDEGGVRAGADLYLTTCSGCHGQHVHGGMGPALGDSFWSYPLGRTDKGLFELIYDGARASMGPQRNQLSIDEMLKVMSYIRSIYWGEPEYALWLSEEQRVNLVPAEMPADFREALERDAARKEAAATRAKADSEKAALEALEK